jgi:hypothetical protein
MLIISVDELMRSCKEKIPLRWKCFSRDEVLWPPGKSPQPFKGPAEKDLREIFVHC